MTFIYELDPYCREIHRMCKYELSMSRLSKVVVWQTDRHTYRLTGRIDPNYKARRLAGAQNVYIRPIILRWETLVGRKVGKLPPLKQYAQVCGKVKVNVDLYSALSWTHLLSWPWMAGWLHTEMNVRHRELNPDTVAHLSILTGPDVD